MDVTRQSHRYHVDKRREFSLCIIPFKSLVCAVAVAHVVDLSRYGLGKNPISSWNRFRLVQGPDRRVQGRPARLGQKVGTKYRAGIKFVPLSRDKELLVQGRIDAIRPLQPLHDPEVIISTILESMTRDQTGGQTTPDQAAPKT